VVKGAEHMTTIERALAIVGVIICISGVQMAAVNYQCQTKGEFKTPWWSGSETNYSCKEKNT
jgi:hypothetical protein